MRPMETERAASSHETPLSEPSAATLLVKGLEASGAAALELLSRAQQRAQIEQAWQLEVQAFIARGKVERDLGKLELALEQFSHALDLALHYGDLGFEGDALNQRAGINHLLGEYALALKDLSRALELAKRADDVRRTANVLINIGILRTKLADYPRALEALHEAHKLIRERVKDAAIEGQCLINLGLLYEMMGEDIKALKTCQLALETVSKLENRNLEAITTVNLGYAQKRLGRVDVAAHSFGKARALARDIGFVKVEIAALDGLGQLHASMGEVEKALELHHQALARARETDDFESEIDALLNLGNDHLAAEQPDSALKPLFKALEMAERAERKKAVIEVHERLAEVFERLDNLPAALNHLRTFHELERNLFNEENEQKVRQLSIQFDLERARYEADLYRLQTELEREARERAEAIVRKRTAELEESNKTVKRQRGELQEKVVALNHLLKQNEALRQRLVLAARRGTALNERVLRRLSAELHDGPAQDLGFVLLTLESGEIVTAAELLPSEQRQRYLGELEKLRASVQRALHDMRAVASGMSLPELDHLSLSEVVTRVIRRHQHRTSSKVRLELDEEPKDVALPVKITVYRLVQEALTNAFKHGKGKGQSVRFFSKDEQLHLKISDEGPGFCPDEALEPQQENLGLVGMRERVESLGGSFIITSNLGQGTSVAAQLPLNSKDASVSHIGPDGLNKT